MNVEEPDDNEVIGWVNLFAMLKRPDAVLWTDCAKDVGDSSSCFEICCNKPTVRSISPCWLANIAKSTSFDDLINEDAVSMANLDKKLALLLILLGIEVNLISWLLL